MASPFSIFRRNQRIMLAIIGVMAMIAFVFLDPLFKYLGRAGGPANPVVVEVNSHSFRAAELATLTHSRQIVKNFLHALAIARVQKAAKAGQLPGRDIIRIAENLAENWSQDLMDRAVPPENVPINSDDGPQQIARTMEEAAAIQTLVLATKAEQLGILMTDQTVIDYLKTLTDNTISAAEYETIVRDLRGEAHNMSQAYLFDILRRELLASRYSRMYEVSLLNIPPAPRWEYFRRLKRLATAEVLGVPVERFLMDVPEPSEAEAKAFFKQYAETLPVLNSPNPGFKRPAKAEFQYFLAKLSDFEAKALPEVTAEEIRTYYDKNKDIYFRERKPGEPGSDSDDASSDDAPAGDASPGDAPGGDSPKGSDQPEKPGPGDAEGVKKPAGGAGAAPVPPTDAGKKSSRSVPASSLHLVAQKSDAKKPNATPPAKPADTVPADAKPAAVSPAAGSPAAGSPAAGSAAPAAAGDTPAADSAEGKSDSDGKSDTAAGASPDSAAGSKPDAKPAVAYEPFEKVEEEIRKRLVGEKANKLIDEAFQRLGSKMREYSSAQNSYDANKDDDASLKPPTPLDLGAMASAEGMRAKETGLVSADELEAEELGKSSTIVRDRRTQAGYREDFFPQIGFRDRLFNPVHTQDREGDHFLSWKTQETPEGVPTFEEARQDVVRALKLIQARKLAVAEADHLAKEVRAADKPLSEVFAGKEGFEFVTTNPFSWMTVGPVPFDPSSQPRLSDVHGVIDPGQDFMKAVFNSTSGQIQVAMNEPKTVAYVIQIKGFEPPQDDLELEFLVADFRTYMRLAVNDEQMEYVDWLRWLDRQAGLTWFKPAIISRRARD